MLKYFLTFIIIVTNTPSFADNNNKKESPFSAHFKCISFNYDFSDIGYIESNEFKPLNVSQSYLSNEIYFQGKQEIEFVSLKLTPPPITELDILNSKKSDAFEKVKVLGEEYNRKYAELKQAYNSIREDGSPDVSLQQKINLLSNELNEINYRKQIVEKVYADLMQKQVGNITKNYSQITESKSKTKENRSTRPATQYEPLTKFNIPVSGARYILIFNKTPNGVTISPINDAPGVFPFGSYQFFNLAGTTVELRFGSKVISLSPNGRIVFKPEIANGEYLEGEFWIKIDDEFKLSNKFRKLYLSEVRSLVFLMPPSPNEDTLNLKIAEERGQVESPPAEKPKSKDNNDKESEKKENENKPFG